MSSRAIVDGDAKHKPISAASILAKTARDLEMSRAARPLPAVRHDQHKGYAAEHLEAVGRLGPCAIHRKSFYAVGVFFQKTSSARPGKAWRSRCASAATGSAKP